jgi:hypothetical protein
MKIGDLALAAPHGIHQVISYSTPKIKITA